MSAFEARPHRRLNALSGEWVLVSPHRTLRPWQGQKEEPAPRPAIAHDPSCYLCPGNQRANGQRNPPYEATFVFDNDFAALLPDGGAEEGDAAHDAGESTFFTAEPAHGICRVICFSPRHDLTLADLDPTAFARVIDCWADETSRLGRDWRWVQVFENKGAMMGCSNPHPHGQIWASDALPTDPAREDERQRAHFTGTGRSLLVDYAAAESARRERIVVENDELVAVVPYWATWPFETLIVPRRPVSWFPALDPAQRRGLGDVLSRLLRAYDALFDVSFPYSMGWHGAPTGPGVDPLAATHWQLHAHVFPPLLRSATVRKFMVGYEMMAEAQRDLTPEEAAKRLRAVVR